MKICAIMNIMNTILQITQKLQELSSPQGGVFSAADLKNLIDPINKAIPISSKPTPISSEIIGIRGSTTMIVSPNNTKI